MDNIATIKDLIAGSVSNEYSEIAFIPTTINFIFCIIMSFILRNFYINRSMSLVGKNHIGTILPALACIVFIVIVIVKSSLALSLGLVGALSIVRFRTPIKEPEELVYLFFAIALGLGYGANQTIITTFLSIILLLVLNFWFYRNAKTYSSNDFNLSLSWKNNEITLDEINAILSKYSQNLKIVRADKDADNSMAIFIINPTNGIDIEKISNEIQSKSKNITINFTESNVNW